MATFNDNSQFPDDTGTPMSRRALDLARAFGALACGYAAQHLKRVADHLSTPETDPRADALKTRITLMGNRVRSLSGRHPEVVISEFVTLAHHAVHTPPPDAPHALVYPEAIDGQIGHFIKFKNLGSLAAGYGEFILNTGQDPELQRAATASFCRLSAPFMTQGSLRDARAYFDATKRVLDHTNDISEAHHIASRHLPTLRDQAREAGHYAEFMTRLGGAYDTHVSWLGYDPVERVRQDGNGQPQP